MKKFIKIIVSKKNKLDLVTYDLPQISSNEVLIHSLFSGISHATELGVIHGTIPSFHKQWLKEKRIYVKGTASKKYPSTLGYENVGKIIEVGSDVAGFKKGDIVWSDSPHQEYSVVNTIQTPIYRIPHAKYIKQAVFLALTRVALAGIHDARIQLGDRVAVFGLGTVGQITAQLARLASNTEIFGVDFYPLRRKVAEKDGVLVIDPARHDVALKIHELTADKGVDIAIETSGSTAGLHEAIRSCRLGGKVVTVATYREGAKELVLSEEWHRNRIEMISSMSVNGCPHRDHPRWDLNRLNRTALDLLIKKKIKVEHLITHIFPMKEAPKAYDLIIKHPEKTLKVVFSY